MNLHIFFPAHDTGTGLSRQELTVVTPAVVGTEDASEVGAGCVDDLGDFLDHADTFDPVSAHLIRELLGIYPDSRWN